MSEHVALSHTPFHLLQFGLIAQDLHEQGETLRLFHEGSLNRSVPGIKFAESVELPGFTGYRSGRRIAEENAKAILSHAAWQDPHAVMYASDLKWLTNNAVWASRPRAVRRRQTVLITDGLGSYLQRKDLRKTLGTALAKKGLGLIGYGPRHRVLPRNHFGLDSCYAAVAVGLHADRIVGDIAKRELVVSVTERSVTQAESTLVLGSPLDEHRYTRSSAAAIVQQMVTTAASITPPNGRLLYKPHHFEAPSIAAEYMAAGFSIVNDTMPAEILVRQMGIRRLVGAYSSALAFGPAYADSPCEAYSVCFDEFAAGYLSTRDRDVLRDVLAGFGVRFL